MTVLSWINYLQLLAACVTPAIIAIVLHYFLKKWKWFKKRNYWIQQLMIGAVFSLLALCSFYFGVEYNTISAKGDIYSGIVGNFGSANASPIIAGLVFGGPSGLISGFAAGIYRLVMYPFGSGDYLRGAECLTVFAAGGISWLLRVHLFDNKKPKWFYGLIIGLFIETIHMLLIFAFAIGNKDSVYAYGIVRACDIPCVVTVGLSIIIALLGITILEKEKIIDKVRNDKRIATKIQRWFALTFAISLTVTFLFTYLGNYTKSSYEVSDTLQTHCSDVNVQVNSDTGITNPTIKLKDNDEASKEHIKNYHSETYHSLRYHRINLEGVCALLDGTEENKFRILSYNHEFDEYYKIPDAFLGNLFHFSDEKIKGPSGYHYMEEYKENTVNKVYLRINNIVYSYFMRYNKIQTNDGRSFYVLSMIYVYEAKLNMGMTVRLTCFLELLIFIIIFGVIYAFIKKVVVSNVHKINKSLDLITGGNLQVKVNVRSNQEFSDLSDDINQTVDTLKHFIDEANKRIDNELMYAKEIQQSQLPVIFPTTKAYDLYATMHTAKQVGGDFYDFFPVDKTHMFFLMADVSGKGIPAAMFMMRAKTLVKSLVQTNELTLDQIITGVNDELNRDNKTGMFVTAWFGILNINTGEIEYVNAGHCNPLVGESSEFEYLRMAKNCVLGVIPGIDYKLERVKLKPNESIILYTDGVTEATSKKKQLFGEPKLLEIVNNSSAKTSKDMLEVIHNEVDKFQRGAEQADDITMLMVKYKPKK